MYLVTRAAPCRMRAAADAGDGISRLADRKALGGRLWFLNLISRCSLPLNLDRRMVFPSPQMGTAAGGDGQAPYLSKRPGPVDALWLARAAKA